MSKNALALVERNSVENRLEHFTMTANWFFDHLLFNENISVARVVGYFFRNTFGRTGPDGRRIEMLQASHKWLAGRTGLSERAVGDGLRKAVAKKYLIEVRAGHKATKDAPGEGGWYRVNWDWLEQNYVKLVEPLETAQSLPDTAQVSQTFAKDVTIVTAKEPEAAQTLPGVAAQTLPDTTPQTLPACINTPELDLNKPIEIKARAERDEVSVSALASSSETKAKKPAIKPKKPYSQNIAELIASFTPELGDNPARKASNIRRALNLWAASGLAEKEFVALLYQCRQKARACDKVQHRRDGRPNRMPYFFIVISNQLSVVSNQSVEVDKGDGPDKSGEPVASEERFFALAHTHKGRDILCEPVASEEDFSQADTPFEGRDTVAEAALSEGEADDLISENMVEAVENVAAARPDAPVLPLPLPDWLTSAQRQALAQAEVSREKLGTHVRFSLKLARSWHKDCFQDWHLQRLALALADVDGSASLVILE